MGALVSAFNSCQHVSVSINSGAQPSQSKPILKLLLIGLDNAGKTTTVMHLVGKPIEDVVPTVGFSNIDMKAFHKFRVQIYDLGGGAKIRAIWKNYFALVHGLIYVIDSADAARVTEVKESLIQVISNEKVAKKPILILINKQDIEGALDETDVLKDLDLQALVNKHQCPTKIESCSASANYNDVTTKMRRKKTPIDAGIDRGYFWLVKFIVHNWNELNERVERESNEQIEIEKQIMQERFKRFRAKSVDKEDETNETVMNGNPFKPIQEVIANGIKSKPLATDPGTASAKAELTERTVPNQSPTKRQNVHSKSTSPTKHRSQANGLSSGVKVQHNGKHSAPKSQEVNRNEREIEGAGDQSSSPQKQQQKSPKKEKKSKSADLTRSSAKTKKKRPTIFSSNKVTPLA